MLPQIKITGHNIELTNILRNFINDKFNRLTKHSKKITSIHVILSVEKLRQIAEVKIHIPHAEIVVKEESDDMYKTIDLLIDKLVRQLDKHRDRETDTRR